MLMSSMTTKDKSYLEKLFGMNSGYVLDFSDSTMAHFFADTIDVDIHDNKYRTYGSSKAKKLREFWRLEPDHVVGKSLVALLDHFKSKAPTDPSLSPEWAKLFDTCTAI